MLLLAPVLATTSCAPRATDALYPHQALLRVCLRPPTVESDARHWAVNSETGTTVSDNDRDAFDAFLPYADLVYIFDYGAPAESSQLLEPEKYARESCDGPERLLARAGDTWESLPSGDANPLRVVGDFGPHTDFDEGSASRKKFVGIDDKPKTKAVPVIHVCVRPPGMSDKTMRWAATRTQTGMTYTTNDRQFAQAAATAERIFVYDPAAPPESVYEFGPPFDELRCEGKPPPKPRKDADTRAKRRATFEEMVKAALEQRGEQYKPGLGGSPERTWSSSETGKGKQLSFFEAVVRQTLIAQGVLSGDTSGNLKNPNGSRYGLPNGKNVGGPDSFFLQFVVTGFAFLPTIIKTGGQLVKRIAEAAQKGAVLIIADPKLLPKRICEGLITKWQGGMTEGLWKMKTILPYSRASMFTEGWQYLYQAHHILEKAMARDVLKISNLDDLPAIILTKKEHEAITKALNAARKKHIKGAVEEATPNQLWKVYQEAYEDFPILLESIKRYFGK